MAISSDEPGLLATELVARHAEHREALVGVLLVQLLEALVLRGEPALGRHVHDEQRLVLVVVEVERRTVEAVDRVVIDRHGARTYPALRELHSPALEVDLDPLLAAGAGPARPRGRGRGDRRRSRPATTGTGRLTRPGSCRPSGPPRAAGFERHLAIGHHVTGLQPAEDPVHSLLPRRRRTSTLPHVPATFRTTARMVWE